MESVRSVISKAQTITIFVLFGLTPFVFIPFTQDPYSLPKWILFLTISGLLMLLWASEILFSRRIHMQISGGFVGFALLTGSAIISLIVSSPNKVEALLSPVGPLTWGALTLIFLLTKPLSAKTQAILKWILVGIALLLSLVAIYQYLEIGKLILPQLKFLEDSAWTPIGSSLGLLSILVMLAPFVLFEFIRAVSRRHDLSLAISGAGSVIISCALVVTIIKVAPHWRANSLPYMSGWAIILETFKVPRQALFGVGAENFLAAFTKGRSEALNTSGIWNVRFDLNSSAIMHIAAIYGTLGLLASLVVVKQLLRKHSTMPLRIAQILAIGALVVFPPNFTVILIISSLLILGRKPEDERTIGAPIHEQFQWLCVTVVILLFCTLGVGGYFIGRAYAAELYYQRALSAIAQKQGTQSYNLLIKTLDTNPFITKYRITYSQVNLGVANGLAASLREASGGNVPTNISDADRKTLSALMSQAIREGKLATSLSPGNTVTWENLAKIYQAMIGAATGSDGWAIAAYQQAIQLDPTNPLLRFELGGLYAQLGAYDQSQTQFQNAVGLKPDYVNAIYNLSFIYKQQKSWLSAAVALKRVLDILPAGDPVSRDRATTDYNEALSHLTAEEKTALLGVAAPKGQDENIELSPLPTPIPTIHPQLELGTESSPSAESQE